MGKQPSSNIERNSFGRRKQPASTNEWKAASYLILGVFFLHLNNFCLSNNLSSLFPLLKQKLREFDHMEVAYC